MGYAKVLVGTDGSESSFRAVDRAAEVAAGTGASLLLFTVYRPMPSRQADAARQELGELAYKVVGSHPAEDILGQARDRAVAAGMRADGVQTLAVEGDPVDAIVETASSHAVDLVVVGNRGLNSLAGRLLGSVPANVSHRAGCDVLIVHTTGK